MTVTINVGEILTVAASAITVIGGIVGFAYFIKQWWQRPIDPVE